MTPTPEATSEALVVKPATSKSLLRSTSLIAMMTSVSRVLGFLRDMVVANLFGAGAMVDAFLVAFKIPNFLRRLFAEGAFSQAFVPVLAQYREQHDHDKTQHFLNHIASALASVLFLVTTAGILLAPVLIFLFAPGFAEESYRFDLASGMLRITFPYLFLISLTAFGGAILNSYDRFGVAAFTPVLLNVAMITTALFCRSWFDTPINALAMGVTIGGVLQLLFQLPFLKKMNLLPRISIKNLKIAFADAGTKKVLRLMLPALFGVSVAQINLLIDTLFASFLPVGSVSWLYFSDRMIEFPLGVFGVALATVSLPRLSRHVANKNTEGFNLTLDWSMRTVLLISVPCALGLSLLAEPILTALFQYGEFSRHDMEMTSRALIAFALGIPAFMMVKIFASAFYSHQEMRTPVRIGIIAMITNTVLNCILIWHFAHAGLAFSTTVAAYLNTALLFKILLKKKYFTYHPGLAIYLLRLFIANGLVALSLYYFNADIDTWLNWSAFDRALHLGYLVVMAAAIYFGSLTLSGFNWKDLKRN